MPQVMVPVMIASTVVAGVGTVMQMQASKKASEAQQQEIALQRKVEEERRKQMELEARRKQLEIIRQQQRARSMALATTTAQGASFGSGLPGAYGQIAGVSGFNMQGVNQNLEIGRNIFGFNSQISDARMAYADAQGMQATGMGISSLGNMMFKNIGTIGSMMGPGTSSSGVSPTSYGGFVQNIGSNGLF
jgi:hypothetical protein